MPRVELTIGIPVPKVLPIKPGGVPIIVQPSYEPETTPTKSSKSSTPTSDTATPNKVRRRSRAVRRSTGITPTEADLDTPDKVDEMGELIGLTPTSTQDNDPLLTMPSGGSSLLVPDVPVYRVPAQKQSPKLDRVTKLNKELESMKRKVEENDCMLIQGLEELRRKDLNIRALEKTEQRLLSTLSQLERDVAKMNQTKSDSDRYVKENASLIRVIGKLSSKVRKS